MGIKYNQIAYSLIVTLGLTLFASACENTSQTGGANCVNCIAEKPDSGYLSIDLTTNNENDSVSLYIYKNKYSDNLVADTVITAIQSPFALLVKTNQYFSVKAVYKVGNKTINAIDGGVFNAQEQSSCDFSCWQYVGGKYNVKLKFD